MHDANKPPSSSIKILAGPEAGTSFQIGNTTINVGRDSSNDIVLSDPMVSRFHARLTYDGSQWNIQKIASRNNITINRRSVEQGIIHNNDTIGLGANTIILFLVEPVAQYQQDPASGNLRQPTPVPPFRQAAPSQYETSEPKQDILFTERAPEDVSSLGIGIPSLEVSTNTSQEKQVTRLTKQVMNIGRDSSNDIVINTPIVSAFHAQIVRMGSDFVIVHPHPQAKQHKTLNGLLYQGRYIRGIEVFRKTLARGDIFRIGDENGTLVTLTFNDGSGATQEALPEIRPIPLGASSVTIGRHPDNTVVLKHPQVSAYHARLEQIHRGGYRIVDLNSTNHVFVNAQQVTNQLLKPADEIRIGPFKLIYTGTELTQHDESKSIRIDAIHLKKVGISGTILLRDISLVIPPRKFIALVGGSGTGKTTLMDALNGLRPAQEGKVLYNGQDYYRSLAAFSTQLGYVPQDDIVHRELSVERALYYAAKLRLPNDFTESQIQQRIEEVLGDVEMEDRRGLLVSKLSGGQRKRVSIALELLANPSIFFLDEPTSGLDPGLDRKMMFLLRKLADKGHTIVLVTHATNNINVCDYVCFLARGGRLAYYGPPDDTKKFFNKTDFAEIYTSLEPTKENPDAPEQAERNFKCSQDYQKYVDEPLIQGHVGRTIPLKQASLAKQAKRSHSWKQFILLSQRYMELLRNDLGNLLILLLQAPIIGLILLLILKFVTVQGVFEASTVTSPLIAGDAQKILFVMSFAAVMFGCINGAREIVKEGPIYRRERAVNLGLIPYMFSKIVVLGALCLLQSAILVLIVNAVEPFHQGVFLDAILEVYITLALTALAGLMVGLLISTLVLNNDRAMSMIPIILIPQVIFAGTIFPLKSGFMQVLGMFFAVRWAMAALGSSMGLISRNLGDDKLIGSIDSYHGTLSSSTFMGYSQANATQYLLFIWLAMLAMIIVVGFLIAYFLKQKDVKVY